MSLDYNFLLLKENLLTARGSVYQFRICGQLYFSEGKRLSVLGKRPTSLHINRLTRSQL